MDLNRLRYFCTVAEAGSLRAAAGILHLSPAALSKSIKLLEHELEQQLLAPSGRGIIITDAGKLLAKKAQRIFEEVDSLSLSLRRTANEESTLRLGSFEVFTTYFLGPLMKDYLKDIPIIVHELVPGHLEEALQKREIDLGITYIPIPANDLDHLRVATIDMGLYGVAHFQKKKFDELPFVVPVSPITGSPNKVRGLDGWPDDQLKRTVVYKVTLLESAFELCRQGVAVGYFPRFVVELHNQMLQAKYQLKPINIPKKLTSQKQEVYIIKRKSDIEDVNVKKLAKALRLECKI